MSDVKALFAKKKEKAAAKKKGANLNAAIAQGYDLFE